jgi:tRNA dimethylallyltransferase
LIDVADIGEQFHAGRFVRSAERLIEEIVDRGKIPVLSGGTAFYLRSFLFGLSRAPEGLPGIREELEAQWQRGGAAELLRELRQVDPETASRIHENDSYRIIRALEVVRSSGKPLSSYRVPDKIRGDYAFFIIGLHRDREELYARIDARVRAMMSSGLVGEFKALYAEGCRNSDPGMKGIGYREFFTMAEAGCMGFADLRSLIQRNSRRYAKRQMTFFKKIPGIRWYNPGQSDLIRRETEVWLAERGYSKLL